MTGETLTLIFQRLRALLSLLMGQLRPETRRQQYDKNQRSGWDHNAVWYRLRYDDAQKARTMLLRLGGAGGKRVGLRFRYVDRTTLVLHLGVESKYAAIAEEMSPAFGCRLQRSEPLPPLVGTFAYNGLPADFLAADAYIIEGEMYALPHASNRQDETEIEEVSGGLFFPAPGARAEQTAKAMEAATGVAFAKVDDWQLPPPALGTATKISLSLTSPRILFRRDDQWLLGWDKDGRSIGAHQAGVMGDNHSVEQWLIALLTAVVQNNERNVVVLDGNGDLVDALLSRPHLMRLVHSGIVHVLDVRQSGQAGFNPMALPFSQSIKAAAVRWNWWLQGMGVQTTIPITLAAAQDGVRTIPDLYLWTKQLRQSKPDVSASMTVQIERLDNDPDVREWLMGEKQFVDPRSLARRGIVLATGRFGEVTGNKQARFHAMRGLLGLLVESKSAIVLHGVKLDKSDRKLLQDMRFIVSHMTASVTVITRCDLEMAGRLSSRFLSNGSTLVAQEHLQLLPPRTVVVSGREGNAALVSWKTKL